MIKKPLRILSSFSILLFLSACAEDKPLNTFEPRGPKAQTIYDLMYPLVWAIMAIIFVLVIGGTILIVLKGRIRPGDDPDDLPEQTHGNTKLELAWTIAPFVLLAALCVPMVKTIWDLEEKNNPDDLDVMVIGQQWWWEYRYDVDGDGFFRDANGDGVVDELDEELPMELSLDPDDVVTANELVIPTGSQVDLIIGSRDVIHSFWIPRLNGKRDAVPGRWHTWSLNADEPGKYTGWCTEFCGVSHARMRMSTIALEPTEFTAWLDNQKKPAADPIGNVKALAGKATFEGLCMSCHVINDPTIKYPDEFVAIALDSKAAPDLTHFASRSTFAGGTYSTYLGPLGNPNDDALNAADYLKLAEYSADEENEYRFNIPELKRWIRNAPGQKDMKSDDMQGMTPFPQLSDDELDEVVAYLETLE